MKYARILDVTWLDDPVPTDWPEACELDENEQPINVKSFVEYLTYPDGSSVVKTIHPNGLAGWVVAFSRNAQPVADALVDGLAETKITFITEEEFRAFLVG